MSALTMRQSLFSYALLTVTSQLAVLANWSPFDNKYGHFSEQERLEMKQAAKMMFYHGYDNYMKYAFPQDELNPIDCKGRGPDYQNPSNININDVLGDYSLTLIDALDTLVIMGNQSEFKRAVQLVIDHVSFDKANTVQVFEVTIRVLGALLSAHLLIIEPSQPFGDIRPADYDGQLLSIAHDLASRLLPAFEHTSTGIPYPRVNLQSGVPWNSSNETCTSGAGSLLVEFGILSRLLGDPVYEAVARRAVLSLWRSRSRVTGLLGTGNVINIHTGEWVGQMSGLGAGLDSFYEYLFKSFILFGDEQDHWMFNESYATIKYHMRRGRKFCNNGTGNPPIYVNVNMKSGETVNHWIDSLQASWAGLQVLYGDIEEAICSHALYYCIWRKFDLLPERYNWQSKVAEILFYPLRPELVESTYMLYQATNNPFYLHVGKAILNSINEHTKVKCGYATVHSVHDKDLEDRMESFFLSETTKYLYLLFDKENFVNTKGQGDYIFSTEGHLLPVSRDLRKKSWESVFNVDRIAGSESVVDVSHNTSNCDSMPEDSRFFLPIKDKYLQQLELAIGLTVQPSNIPQL